VKELEQVLANDDPRWGEFGLETPAASRASKPARDKKAKAKSASRLQAEADQAAANAAAAFAKVDSMVAALSSRDAAALRVIGSAEETSSARAA
jgi:hypothetical protein